MCGELARIAFDHKGPRQVTAVGRAGAIAVALGAAVEFANTAVEVVNAALDFRAQGDDRLE